jgi:hypothetical protein
MTNSSTSTSTSTTNPTNTNPTNTNPTATTGPTTRATPIGNQDIPDLPRKVPSRAMVVAAGLALCAGPLLWAGGMVTSPPQESMADADYISSLTRDTTMTQVSALFLHYGNLVIALGILAGPSLVRGARGLRLAVAGALATALGFANVSGLVLSVWWNASAGTHLSSEQAVEVFRGFKTGSLLPFWDGTEPLSLIGPLLLLAGLARAGVLGWWTLALLVAGVAGLMVFGATSPLVAAAFVLVGFSPFALVGRRLLQRSRLA